MWIKQNLETTVIFAFRAFISNLPIIVAERLVRWTCHSEVPSSRPTLTASWIRSLWSRVQILGDAYKIANWFAFYQLGFVTMLSLSIWIIGVIIPKKPDNWRGQLKTTYFCVAAIKSKREKKGKTWSRGTNSRLPFGVNINLNLYNILLTGLEAGSVKNWNCVL